MYRLAPLLLIAAITFAFPGAARAYQDPAPAIGWTQVDLVRVPTGDGLLAEFIDDALFQAINSDADSTNDVDLILAHSGLFKADICADPLNCHPTGLLNSPFRLTAAMLSAILPSGDTVLTGEMTGAQIADALNQGNLLAPGMIQPSRLRYHYYRYRDTLPGPQPWAWGAFSVEIKNRATGSWEALDARKAYQVGVTSELVSSLRAFTYLKSPVDKSPVNAGRVIDRVTGYITATYTQSKPYKGPTGNGQPDGRILRDGNDSSGTVVPLTVLHHNDSHGNLLPYATTNPKTGTVYYLPGYTQLATLIKQERAHNPTRTLLLSAGDTIQGDPMTFFFRYAGLGYTADQAPISNPDLRINPMIKVFNSMQYTAMTLGNHEFSFGRDVFSTLKQATFPILQANISDDGRYGLSTANIQPYVEKSIAGIHIAILGIGSNSVLGSELPDRTTGLSFSTPITTAQSLAPTLDARNDVVIALTHIGFTADPGTQQTNTDTNLARSVPGVNLVIGGHSHTDPVTGMGAYAYLPAMEASPNGTPILIGQARSNNSVLGEIILGLLPKSGGGYTVVSEAGRAIEAVYSSIPANSTPEDPAVKALVDPYAALLNTYLNGAAGSTAVPVDATLAYTAETNSANLQADAAKWAMNRLSVPVDLALLGAASNKMIARGASAATPYAITVRDLFTVMPDDSALVVMNMTGPQIKRVLERAYRNYWYYQFVPGFGGYAYDTIGMLVPDSAGHIQYLEAPPNGNNVRALTINGAPVDLSDPSRTYRVLTIEDLATGSCNNTDNQKTIWPLNAIVSSPNIYSREAITAYLRAQPGPVTPQVTGRVGWSHVVWIPIVFK